MKYFIVILTVIGFLLISVPAFIKARNLPHSSLVNTNEYNPTDNITLILLLESAQRASLQ